MRVWIVCLLLGLLTGSLRSEPDDSAESDESDESFDELKEVTLAVTLEEQVASLRNGTQTNNQTLSRLEAFYEELERRILRLEAANNGTRDIPESVDESLTSPAPETTTNLPCCSQIKLKSRGSMTNYGISSAFLGVYQYQVGEDTELFSYHKLGTGDNILSNSCNTWNLRGYNTIADSQECEEPTIQFHTGFSGSCITGPTLFTVSFYADQDYMDDWQEDDSLRIVCVD